MKKLLLLSAILILPLQITLQAQTQIGLDIDGAATDDRSGYSTSLNSDGTIVAISAVGIVGAAGSVRMYQYASNSWTQLGQAIDGEAADDRSGYSVSLSDDGSIVAISSFLNDGNGTSSGQVRVYQYASNSWTQLGQDIDGEAAGDESGRAVSLSSDGSIVAVGAPSNDGNGQSSGHVRVYQYASNSWTQIGQDIDGEAASDFSGWSVSLSSDGSKVAIGAITNAGNGSGAGHVRVYQYASNSWSQLGQDIDGVAGDNSGRAVSLSSDGSIVAIGAYYNSTNGSNSGTVRVYQYVSNSWTQLGQSINGEAASDQSGQVLSLSNGGSIVAIGAPYNDGNGADSGHARVYQYDGNNWIQRGQDIDGEAAGDESGWSVSLSNDGSIVAIGAVRNDGNGGARSGHTRVFDLSGVLSVESINNELNITLYPNPLQDILNIANAESGLLVTIYDALGKEVLSKQVTDIMDVSSLKTGVYMVKLSDGNKMSTLKMIKN